MIVVPSLSIALPATEVPNHIIDDVTASCSLKHGKLVSNLPFQSHLVTSVDRTAEAAFSIYEAHDPSDVAESFLLVFRRGPCHTTHRQIVTAIHVATLMTTYDKKSMTSTGRIHRVFQQIASCTHQRHRWEGQHPLLHQESSTLGRL